MSEEKNLTVSDKAGLPVVSEGPEVISSDILIPRLLLAQGLSDCVAARKAQLGDMVRSTTLDVIGGPEKPLSFIPLKLTRTWIEQEKIGGKYEWRKVVPRTAANDDLPWEFQANGADWKRVKAIEVFALLVSDVEAYQTEMAKVKDGEMPDLSKSLLPILISFRSTSYQAGKAISTYYAQVQDMLRFNSNVRSYAYSLGLSCEEETNEKGTYYVYKVDGKPKKVAPSLLPEVERWYGYVNSGQAIAVAEDEAEPVARDGKAKF